MQINCEHCYTLYNLPDNATTPIGCPYCGHANESKMPVKNEQGPDQSRTMVNYLEGETKEEVSAIKKLTLGNNPSLPSGLEMLVEILEGEKKGQKFAARKARITVGRKGSDILLNDAEVSRHHCVIAAFGEIMILRDLGSSNGTMVNQYIVKETFLKSEDKIRLGDTVMTASLRKIP